MSKLSQVKTKPCTKCCQPGSGDGSSSPPSEAALADLAQAAEAGALFMSIPDRKEMGDTSSEDSNAPKDTQ